ncbi:RING-H2 finger protein ATL1-like [Cynara cardunculus var. scolymus]|uniref:RING-H2 finger protein ATL1-like n=1 Tax=Cynara cardunculus var. scolymus TaxID=59895 RepID=UPI000D62F929|nr:RING-H2 finger protein ATL1-like [Cynara cardunculus var. scolymus]
MAASSPAQSPSFQPSSWSPIVIAIIGTMGTLFLVFSYFNILRRCTLHNVFFSANGQRRRLHDTIPDGNDPSLQFQSRGLDSLTLQMMPVTQFEKKSKSADKVVDQNTECAICLGEYEEDEWVKTIPNCCHVFHVACIDTWFQTHSSCPLCRSDVFDLEVSVSTCGSLGGNLIREDVDEERSAFYQALRSHILQNSNMARLEN